MNNVSFSWGNRMCKCYQKVARDEPGKFISSLSPNLSYFWPFVVCCSEPHCMIGYEKYMVKLRVSQSSRQRWFFACLNNFSQVMHRLFHSTLYIQKNIEYTHTHTKSAAVFQSSLLPWINRLVPLRLSILSLLMLAKSWHLSHAIAVHQTQQK